MDGTERFYSHPSKHGLQNRCLGFQERDASRCFGVFLQQGTECGLQYVVAKRKLFGVFLWIRGFSFAYVHEHPKMFFISRLSSNSYKDHLVKQHVRAQKHVSTSIRAIKTRENYSLKYALLAVFFCFYVNCLTFFCICTWNVCCFKMVSVLLVQ